MRKLFINFDSCEMISKVYNIQLFEEATRKFLKNRIRKYITTLIIDVIYRHPEDTSTNGWFYIDQKNVAHIQIFVENIENNLDSNDKICAKIFRTLLHEIGHFVSFSKFAKKHSDEIKISDLYKYFIREQAEIEEKFTINSFEFADWYRNNPEEQRAELYAWKYIDEFMNI